MGYITSVAAQSTTGVEHRSDATYSYSDWDKLPPERLYDTPPTPAGGMHAFISQLRYPSELRRRHTGGTVRVMVSVDAAGHLLEAKVLQSAGAELDRLVLDAVHRTRWSPATKNHAPVGVKVSFPITFKPPHA